MASDAPWAAAAAMRTCPKVMERRSLSGLQRMQIFALIAAIEAGYHVRPDGLEMRARQMSLLRRLILEGLDDRVAMLPVQPVEPEVEGVRLVLPDSLLH